NQHQHQHQNQHKPQLYEHEKEKTHFYSGMHDGKGKDKDGTSKRLNTNKAEHMELFKQFKRHFDETRHRHYDIIDKLDMFDQEEIDSYIKHKSNNSKAMKEAPHVTNIQSNTMLYKLAQNEEILSFMFQKIQSKQCDLNNIRDWKYELTRIDLDIMGFQIRLQNEQAYLNQNSFHRAVPVRSRQIPTVVNNHFTT
ncbi:hypothetical protein RFI_07663, partial [Reticulomyxa filosa]